MANLAFSGPKASQKEAKKALMNILADNWTNAFTVDIYSDGGGAVIRAIVECADTDEHLDKDFVAKLPPKFMGWRLVILKVPIGHVRVFYSS